MYPIIFTVAVEDPHELIQYLSLSQSPTLTHATHTNQGKTNFFERRVGEYQKANVMACRGGGDDLDGQEEDGHEGGEGGSAQGTEVRQWGEHMDGRLVE